MERVLEGLLLGAVQGITEWIPISSEGVLTLVQLHLLGRDAGESIAFAIWLHVGTLLAAVFYFRRELLHLMACLPAWLSQRDRMEACERAFMDFLFLATVVTGIVGVPLLFIGLRAGVHTTLATAVIGLLLIATGLLQRHAPHLGRRTLRDLTWGDAGLVGLMQGLSALPGISRSGFTVSALLLRGYQEEQALKISFMMSVPAIFGVQILLELGGAFEFDGVTALAGAASATVMGWLTLGALMKLARRLPFWAFAMGLGVLSLVAAFLN